VRVRKCPKNLELHRRGGGATGHVRPTIKQLAERFKKEELECVATLSGISRWALAR